MVTLKMVYDLEQRLVPRLDLDLLLEQDVVINRNTILKLQFKTAIPVHRGDHEDEVIVLVCPLLTRWGFAPTDLTRSSETVIVNGKKLRAYELTVACTYFKRDFSKVQF
jgi:hypothetical protein